MLFFKKYKIFQVAVGPCNFKKLDTDIYQF